MTRASQFAASLAKQKAYEKERIQNAVRFMKRRIEDNGGQPWRGQGGWWATCAASQGLLVWVEKHGVRHWSMPDNGLVLK